MTRLAYSLDAASEAVSLSVRTLRGAIKDGSLTAHYSGSKLLIEADDLRDFIKSLPTHKKVA